MGVNANLRSRSAWREYARQSGSGSEAAGVECAGSVECRARRTRPAGTLCSDRAQQRTGTRLHGAGLCAEEVQRLDRADGQRPGPGADADTAFTRKNRHRKSGHVRVGKIPLVCMRKTARVRARKMAPFLDHLIEPENAPKCRFQRSSKDC